MPTKRGAKSVDELSAADGYIDRSGDDDIRLGYRIFLGRASNPGDALQSKRDLPLGGMVVDFLVSDEADAATVKPGLSGGGDRSPVPDAWRAWARARFGVVVDRPEADRLDLVAAIVATPDLAQALDESGRGGWREPFVAAVGRRAASVDGPAVAATADDVREVYKLLLSRAAESDAVVALKVGRPATELLADFALAGEFKIAVLAAVIHPDGTYAFSEPIDAGAFRWASAFFGVRLPPETTTRGQLVAAVLDDRRATAVLDASRPAWPSRSLAEAAACYRADGVDRVRLAMIAPGHDVVARVLRMVLGREPEARDQQEVHIGLSAFEVTIACLASDEFRTQIAEPALSGAFSDVSLPALTPDQIVWGAGHIGVRPSRGPTSRTQWLAALLSMPAVAARVAGAGVGWGCGAVAQALRHLAESGPARATSPRGRAAAALARLGDAQRTLLRACFSPGWYGVAADTTFTDEAAAWRHYLDEGLAAGIAPSPLFEPASPAAAGGHPANPDDLPPVLHWLGSPDWNVAVPTRCFDPDFYARAYPDVVGQGFSAFQHYILHGRRENRRPNAIFDPTWYRHVSGDEPAGAGLSAYEHYLGFGIPAGKAPCKSLLSCVSSFDNDTRPDLAAYLRLCEAMAPVSALLPERMTDILLSMFEPSSHRGPNASGARASSIDLLVAYLSHGFWNGDSPGPLFDPAAYAAGLEAIGQAPVLRENLLLHFLSFGLAARLSPTAAVDIEAYLKANPDLATGDIVPFEHLANHGRFESWRPLDVDRPMVTIAMPQLKAMGPEDVARIQFWAARGRSSAPLAGLLAGVRPAQERVLAALAEPEMQRMIARAVELEPAVGPASRLGPLLAPPYHDPRMFVRRLIRQRLAHERYDTVICMPWLRTGGADLVACMLAKAVASAAPGERILILRTDHAHMERADWVPAGVECIDVSSELSALPELSAEFVLYGLFLRLGAKRVVNVNSRRCWNTIKRFGARLRRDVFLYSYLFCWDQLRDGTRVGYPSEFFTETAAVLQRTFTDSEYLRTELLRIYRPPAHIAERVLPLFSPARSEPTETLMAALSLETAAARPRARILWAGRLDWQKQFHIVQAVARRMPEVDFVCWGKVVLGDAPTLGPSPENVVLNDAFSEFDDLPLARSDLWLFTSAWEGMPTTLIELAIRGVAIVASSVGAVPELVDGSTGWPVYQAGDVEDYVATIRAALADPDARVARATRLQQRAASRYVEHAYAEQIRGVFAQERRP